ncbi:two-component system cell cycle response regulator [Massilia aurea]|uniref:Two-component system cell cycle response regulator n=1 Tax=Massilia aurea TaxID=373040 RepID=A0A7W9U6E2_9BURK|nr:two-component system cell cycle response regulator [Massilia aurea]
MARILIIEDNPANIELMSFLLSAYGHAPLSAADGPRGVAAARSERPDLIACDVNLPGMDGFAVLAELKGDPALAGVPILAVTALAMTGDREKVLAAGFDGYISKPIEPESFVAELEAFLTSTPAPASAPAAPAAPAAAATAPVTAMAANDATANDAMATAVTPATGARTLLLVDDDRFMLGVLNDMLIGQPYRVLSACSGEEALQVLSHEPVEVILCDQAMPGMRGTEVLAEAAARYPKTVRLMLSGQPDLTDIEAAIKSGVADGHYIKPLGARALREQLDEAFRLQSARGTG